MHCTACAMTIDLDLEDLPGVKSSKTNYAKQVTQVEFDPAQVQVVALLATVAKSGYEAVV